MWKVYTGTGVALGEVPCLLSIWFQFRFCGVSRFLLQSILCIYEKILSVFLSSLTEMCTWRIAAALILDFIINQISWIPSVIKEALKITENLLLHQWNEFLHHYDTGYCSCKEALCKFRSSVGWKSLSEKLGSDMSWRNSNSFILQPDSLENISKLIVIVKHMHQCYKYIHVIEWYMYN